MLRKKKVLQENLLCVDWQRYSKLHEDIRKIRIRFEFFFSDVCFPRKGSLEGTIQAPWNLNAKTCNVVLNIFSKADHLERKNQEGTNLQRAKEQRLVFIHSLVHLPAKLWQCESTCRSFAVLDSVFNQRSKSQHSCCHNNCNTKFPLNIVEQNPHQVTPFSLGTQNLNDTSWSTMAVTLSVSSESVKSTRAISRAIFQHRQMNW